MADLTFTTTSGQTIKRELMICYLNTGTSSTPVWSALGKRVEDSSAEYDWETNSIRDILGATYNTLKSPIVSQQFEPVKLDAGDVAYVKLWNLAVKDQDAQALAAQDILVVHYYTTGNFAERYPSSMIEISSIGGEGGGDMEMPFTVTYGGTRAVGTATNNNGTVSFTEAT